MASGNACGPYYFSGTNIPVSQMPAVPYLTDKEALEKSVKLELAHRRGLKIDDPVNYDVAAPLPDTTVNVGGQWGFPVPEGEDPHTVIGKIYYLPSRRDRTEEEQTQWDLLMEELLGVYNEEIRSCNFPPSEEQDYILRFTQMVEKLLEKAQMRVARNMTQFRTEDFKRLAGKVIEGENEARDHPERVTKTFKLRQAYRRADFEKAFPGVPPSIEEIEKGFHRVLDGIVNECIEKIIGPMVSSAKERTGRKPRTERMKWDDINRMVTRAFPLMREILPDAEGIWWDEALGGIPDWYKPIWYKDSWIR